MFLAIDNIFIAMLYRRSCYLSGGTARIGLCDAYCRLVATKNTVGGEALLPLRAIFHHRTDCAYICLNRDLAHSRTAARHLLDDQ